MEAAQLRRIAASTENLFLARRMLISSASLGAHLASREPNIDAEIPHRVGRLPHWLAYSRHEALRALQCARDIEPGTDLARSIDDVIKMQTPQDDSDRAMVQALDNILARLGWVLPSGFEQ